MTPRHARQTTGRALYSLGVPVNFRRDDITGAVPGAPQQDTAKLDLGAVTAVRLAQVEYINPAVVGEGHHGLRGLLTAAAAHAESGPRSCAHKRKSRRRLCELRFPRPAFRDRNRDRRDQVRVSRSGRLSAHSARLSQNKTFYRQIRRAGAQDRHGKQTRLEDPREVSAFLLQKDKNNDNDSINNDYPPNCPLSITN